MIKKLSIKVVIFSFLCLVICFSNVSASDSLCLDFLSKNKMVDKKTKDFRRLARMLTFTDIYQKTSLDFHSPYILNVQFDENGLPNKRFLFKYFSSGSNEGRHLYWIEDLINPENLVYLEGEFSEIEESEFNSDGTELRVSDFYYSTPTTLVFSHRIFDTATGKLKHTIHPKWGEGTHLIKLSKDFKTGLLSNADGTISVFDYSKMDPTEIVNFHAESANMSEDGKFIVARNRYRQKVFKIENGYLVEVLETPTSSKNYKEQFSADGRFVFVKDRLTSAGIYSLESGREVARFTLVRNHKVVMAPSGDYVLLVRGERFIVIDTLTGHEKMNALLPATGNINMFSGRDPEFHFSEDSKHLGMKCSSYNGLEGPAYEYFILDIENGEAIKVDYHVARSFDI